jgi:phosphoglycerol transferase MdoB-like AlkP superfamily enzyme
MGGFLFNLRVEAMEEPKAYSEKTIDEITEKYQPSKKEATEEPNIIYIMSESFSDPSHLNGLEITGDPLKEYYERANQTYSGKMLSQNYGGGTANIEFEALTSFSMELFNPQMTTPYTLLVPKMDNLPSVVSLTAQRGYETTAIHPYDTSMYKRKDVYDILGFNRFLDQETMKHTDKIEQNPYISDKAA